MDIKWRVYQYGFYNLRMEEHEAGIEAVMHECDDKGNCVERTVAFDDRYVYARHPERDADSWKRKSDLGIVRVCEYWRLSEEEAKRRFRRVNCCSMFVGDIGLAIKALRSIGVDAIPTDMRFSDDIACEVANGQASPVDDMNKLIGKSGYIAVFGAAPLLMRANMRPHKLFKAWETVRETVGIPYNSRCGDEITTMEAAKEIVARPEVKTLMRMTLHDLLNNENNGLQMYILRLRGMYYVIAMDGDNTGYWYRIPRSVLRAADENTTRKGGENALYWRFRLYNETFKVSVTLVRGEYAGIIAQRLVSKMPEPPVVLNVSEELKAINAGIEPMSEEHVFVLPLHNHRFRRYQAAIYAAFAENEIVLGHDENEMYSILNELMKSEILVNSDKLVAFVDEDRHFSYFAFLTDDGYRWFRVPSYIGCQWAKGVVEAGGRVYNTVCFIEDIIDADVDREDDEDNKEGETWYVPVLNEMLNEYYERVEEEDGDE